MIYAETGMERMPEGCNGCKRMTTREKPFSPFRNYYACRSESLNEIRDATIRPNWCPLREGKLKRIGSDPDTAEKLLWLVENLYFDGRGKSIYVCKNEKMFSAYYENHEEYLEAINIVYKWAKEQENG